MTGQLDWLLGEFVRETPGVEHALLVSSDGLRLAASPGVGVVLGDQLSAAASGLISLARGTAQLLGAGALTQTILEMAGGYLFITTVGPGATLAVYAERRCDIGMIGYEMTMLASRVGHVLNPAPRTAGS
ncbi:roadblock/LC7 domain-containing protein [Pseudonocardia sp. K10HN5]|uniref:Roadblock/LC7 domain-containing protein n=1 Tax=Pseudonocardia acidicola TaxID=2724939 RepID=A0ABX1SE36_9PSEU|nr:roadblock/LC7 domain-containing protein [Pseudonocardia acidicola]